MKFAGNRKKTIFASEIAFDIMDKRVFKRKIYDRILQWKQESNGESALMIQGANLVFPSIEALCNEWEKLFNEING